MSNENTQLTVIDRARDALESSTTAGWLRSLAGNFTSITAITNAAGRAECHAAYMVLKESRLTVQKASKAAREDAVRFGQAVIAEEKSLVSIVTAEEERLRKLRDVWDDEEERKRAEKAEANRRRVFRITETIMAIRNAPVAVAAGSAEIVAKQIAELQATEIDDSFSEFFGEAADAKALALSTLMQMLDGKQRAEEEAAKAREENRLEAERLAKEKREADAKRAEERRIAKIEAAELEATRADLLKEQEEIDAKREAIERKAAEDVAVAEIDSGNALIVPEAVPTSGSDIELKRKALNDAVDYAQNALVEAKAALVAFENTAESNVFPTLEEAVSAIEGHLCDLAFNDCEGAGNVGNDSYCRGFMVGVVEYLGTLAVTYNRHDTLYYYIDDCNFTYSEVST